MQAKGVKTIKYKDTYALEGITVTGMCNYYAYFNNNISSDMSTPTPLMFSLSKGPTDKHPLILCAKDAEEKVVWMAEINRLSGDYGKVKLIGEKTSMCALFF